MQLAKNLFNDLELFSTGSNNSVSHIQRNYSYFHSKCMFILIILSIMLYFCQLFSIQKFILHTEIQNKFTKLWNIIYLNFRLSKHQMGFHSTGLQWFIYIYISIYMVISWVILRAIESPVPPELGWSFPG